MRFSEFHRKVNEKKLWEKDWSESQRLACRWTHGFSPNERLFWYEKTWCSESLSFFFIVMCFPFSVCKWTWFEFIGCIMIVYSYECCLMLFDLFVTVYVHIVLIKFCTGLCALPMCGEMAPNKYISIITTTPQRMKWKEKKISKFIIWWLMIKSPSRLHFQPEAWNCIPSEAQNCSWCWVWICWVFNRWGRESNHACLGNILNVIGSLNVAELH